MRHDHALLRTRIQRLGGPTAIARLEAALNAARAAAASAATNSPTGTPMTSPRRSVGEASSPSPIRAAESAAASVHPRSAGGAGDANGVATASNESLMWELLYNLEWQMPMAELEKLWTDALGESGEHISSLLLQASMDWAVLAVLPLSGVVMMMLC